MRMQVGDGNEDEIFLIGTSVKEKYYIIKGEYFTNIKNAILEQVSIHVNFDTKSSDVNISCGLYYRSHYIRDSEFEKLKCNDATKIDQVHHWRIYFLSLV